MSEISTITPSEAALKHDLSALSPQQLADYNLAVTAVQLDGTEIHLSNLIREDAEELIDRTHYDLLVASGDAITKELVPEDGVAAATSWNGVDTSGASAVVALLQNPRLQKYLKPNEEGMPQAQVKTNANIGTEATALLRGIRQDLIQTRGDRPEILRVMTDLAQVSETVFQEIHNQLRGSDQETGGWLRFSAIVGAFSESLQSPDINTQLILANQLINAVHDNPGGRETTYGSILTRFTHYNPKNPGKAAEYWNVMEASRGSYQDQRRYAGYLGTTLISYLEVKKHSLTGLPANKSVPAEFTHLQ